MNDELTTTEKRDIILERLYDDLSNLDPGTPDYENIMKDIKVLEEIKGKEAERIASSQNDTKKLANDKKRNLIEIFGHGVRLAVPIITGIFMMRKLIFVKEFSDENRELDAEDMMRGKLEDRDNKNRRNRVIDNVLNEKI